MKIGTYSNYPNARNAAIAYTKSGKKHPGLSGKEYRVFFYYGEYHLWSGYTHEDFPDLEPVFSSRI